MKLCTVEGCTKPRLARGWCSKHYYRWQRHASLDAPPKRPRRVCAVEGCDETRSRYGYCERHGARFYRNGDPVGGVYYTGSYGHTHNRLRAERGPASDYACVDCGGSALDWSYKNDCPEEQIATLGSRGTVVPFCVHIDNCYEPRCRACHRSFDTSNVHVRVRA